MSDDDKPTRIPVTDVFDLHAVEPKDVQEVIEAFLEEANRLGLKALRIIHGRGIGVQRQIVRAVLARTLFVLSYQDAPPRSRRLGSHDRDPALTWTEQARSQRLVAQTWLGKKNGTEASWVYWGEPPLKREVSVPLSFCIVLEIIDSYAFSV